MTPSDFVAHWKTSQGREESNSGPFLHDLCLAFGLPTQVNVVNAQGRSSTKRSYLDNRY